MLFANLNSGERLVRDSFKEGEFIEKVSNDVFFHHIPCSTSVERLELDAEDLAHYRTATDWKVLN